jgi:hypothetical protein
MNKLYPTLETYASVLTSSVNYYYAYVDTIYGYTCVVGLYVVYYSFLFQLGASRMQRFKECM